MSYIQTAWDKVVENAQKNNPVYLCLMENVPYYGGPEEGGWYGSDSIVVEYKLCHNQEQAEALQEEVEKIANELNKQSKRDFGNQCLKEMQICDNLGVDYDYLPEPDGESTFYVIITNELPENHYGCRHYE